MHTKTLIVVSVMVLLGVLALFAFCARIAAVPVPAEGPTAEEEIVEVETPVVPVVESQPSSDGRMLPPEEVEVHVGEEKFTGTLEEVNVGCFVDGECYVVVDGKHVTVLMGWTDTVVGKVVGVEGFGDLEYFIGDEVSVYAGKKNDGTYTLYQKAEYYVALEGAAGGSALLGESMDLNGVLITPKKVLEDSRCPLGVMCIQAGTLVLETEVRVGGQTQLVKIELGQKVTVGTKKLQLLRADPQPEVGVVAESIFYFGVW